MADLSKLRFNGTDYNVKDASAPKRKFDNTYAKTGNLPITSDDTPQTAIGKLEKALDDKINASAKGTASGVAELDANGKVPSSQLPSYVDDVLEYSAKSNFPATGETGKIYVDTTTNKTYRWSGSAYVEISESLALGEMSSTAYRGDRGKAAYDHSQITNGNPHGTTGANTKLTGYSKGSSKDAVAATDTINAAIAKHENRIDTNQSNILYSIDTGVKNILSIKSLSELKEINTSGSWTGNVYTFNGVTFTVNGDGSYTVTRTASSDSGAWLNLELNSNEDYIGYYLVGGTSEVGLKILKAGTASTAVSDRGSGVIIPSDALGIFYIELVKTDNPNNITIYPMVSYINNNNYVPPALPNYDLTRLEAEDRAALAEEIDAGAKNLFDWSKADLVQALSVSNGVFTTTCTDSQTNLRFQLDGLNSSKAVVENFITNGANNFQVITTNGTYAFPFTMKSNIAYLRFGHNGSQENGRGDINVQHLTAGKTYIFFINVTQCSSSTSTFKWQDTMICTKAAFGVSQKFVPFGNDPFYQVPINHNMIYRGRNLGATLTDAQHTALSSGNFTDLYLGDYWTKTATIPSWAGTGADGKAVIIPEQTNVALKAVIADFDTFYIDYDESYTAGIRNHHAAVIVTGFGNVVWNGTSTAGGYQGSVINNWLIRSVLPQIEAWFGSIKVLSHYKMMTNAIKGDAASDCYIDSQKISLLSENQVCGSKVWANSKTANGGYEPGEAFKHLNIFNHINANLLFGKNNIWLRDIASSSNASALYDYGFVMEAAVSNTGIAPAALILLS